MWWRLFLLFTVTPVVELALLIRIGQTLGVLPTVAIVVATGAAGALLARSQGLLALRRLQHSVSGATFPGEKIFDGVMILIGGLLLLTPGFLTDLIGFAALLPGTRGVLKEIVRRQVRRRIGRRVRTV
ncbi:MAG: FxsA family protein [Gemmatimonadetes bacterium]|nr:FxsA family protein [Gemmatimonadota bacterium]